MTKTKRLSDNTNAEEESPPKKPKIVKFVEPNLENESNTNNTDTNEKKSKIFAGNSKKSKTNKEVFDQNSKLKPKFNPKNKPQNGNNTLTEKPVDWNEFKKQKVELKLKRKQVNGLFDVITKAKKLSEKLRIRNIKGGEEERTKIIEELHELLGNKDNYVKLVLTHDMARVVQQLLKFSPPKIRDEIAKELAPASVEMLQSKYAKFCIERLLKYGSDEARSSVINACYGSVIKLASRVTSASVIANAYSKWANVQQKEHFKQEFYGHMFLKVKDNNIHCLSDVYAACPDLKSATLSAVKGNLSRVLSKELLDSQLIHAVLEEYLAVANEEDRAEIIASLASHAVILSNTKEGAKVVMQCIWHGTNKDRKAIVKSFKEHIKDLASHEHAHTVFITIIDAVDDTVLVSKALLTELVSLAPDLVNDEWGRKVLLWLVAPADLHHFHPKFVSELKSGLQSSTCKKPEETRRQEVLSHCLDPLLRHIIDQPDKWLSKSAVAMVTLAILSADPGTGELKSALNSICAHICNPEWHIIETEGDDTKTILGIEHAGLHMVLKKLALNDKIAATKGGCLFGTVLLDVLNDRTLKVWLQTNRGCFLLITVLESNPEEVTKKLKSLISNHVKLLKKVTTAGANILLKKL